MCKGWDTQIEGIYKSSNIEKSKVSKKYIIKMTIGNNYSATNLCASGWVSFVLRAIPNEKMTEIQSNIFKIIWGAQPFCLPTLYEFLPGTFSCGPLLDKTNLTNDILSKNIGS